MSVIDTSFYQGHPDFQAVKSAGITTVIMKCADGEGGTIVDDSVYVANRASARAVGLAVGSYFFNGNALSPSASAAHQWSIIDWHPGDLVAIDVEGGAGIVWNVAQVAEWCRWMLARGVPAGRLLVYMSSSLEHSLDWSPVVALGVQLWVAQYGANNGTPGSVPTLAHWSSFALWQYTSMGAVPGIAGRVDMNTMSPVFASLSETLITSTTPPPTYEDAMYLIRSTSYSVDIIIRNDGYMMVSTAPDLTNQASALLSIPIASNDTFLNSALTLNGAPDLGTMKANPGKWFAPIGQTPATVAATASVNLQPILDAVNAIKVPHTFVAQ